MTEMRDKAEHERGEVTVYEPIWRSDPEDEWEVIPYHETPTGVPMPRRLERIIGDHRYCGYEQALALMYARAAADAHIGHKSKDYGLRFRKLTYAWEAEVLKDEQMHPAQEPESDG
jgi:hypothetical protein